MLAVKKSDIHDDRIWITSSVKYWQNQPVIGLPKTELSIRAVPLFSPLKSFVDTMNQYVFSNRKGTVASKKSFEECWESYMHCLSEKAGHQILFRPHDLRHTFITKARDKGIDMHIVMNWVGHSSEHMILKIYDHPSANRENCAIEIMDEQ